MRKNNPATNYVHNINNQKGMGISIQDFLNPSAINKIKIAIAINNIILHIYAGQPGKLDLSN